MEKSQLTVSLIIPAYNEEKYIGECLKSVVDSKADFLEIIVVDNGSADETVKIAQSFEGVRVISEEKSGVMYARQKGIDEASGEIVAFIDADTKMLPGWYEQIQHNFSKNTVVSLSGPYIYENLGAFKSSIINIFWYTITLPTYWILGYVAIFGNFAIRRSTLEKMGGINTNIVFYGDDTDTVRRAHKFGKTIFSMNFKIRTSPRRFEQEGMMFTAWRYVINFVHVVLFRKPHTHDQTILR